MRYKDVVHNFSACRVLHQCLTFSDGTIAFGNTIPQRTTENRQSLKLLSLKLGFVRPVELHLARMQVSIGSLRLIISICS